MTFAMINHWLEQNPLAVQMLIATGVILASLFSYFITKHYILKAVSGFIQKTQSKFADILLNKAILKRFSCILPLIIIYSFACLFPSAEDMIRKVAAALIWWFILFASGAFLTALGELYLSFDLSQGRPIKGYIQVLKLIIYVSGGIIIISKFLDRSPFVLLSGFGAMTAVILLIFRDTILSFVASLQITSNDLVRIGDWIEVPKYGADGDVSDIALHTVKVQNWDKTFTVIPTHKLLEETFKNWRGMKASGGRRIKRAVQIDLESIKFCDDQLVEQFKKIHLITEYVERKQDELARYNKEKRIDTKVVVNGRRMTNIGTFRAYIEAYLRNHTKIHQDMTFLVRQLPSGPSGLPIEIYVFTNDTAWSHYEEIQADIFDHILAVVPAFELRLFQNPTGYNFRKWQALTP